MISEAKILDKENAEIEILSGTKNDRKSDPDAKVIPMM